MNYLSFIFDLYRLYDYFSDLYFFMNGFQSEYIDIETDPQKRQ